MNPSPGDFSLQHSDSPEEAFEVYHDLQQRCPIAHTNDYGGYWALTRFEDVRAAAVDSDLFISSVKAVVPSDPRGIRRPPLNYDAPRHTPFRRALARTLSPRRVESLLTALRPRAQELFEDFLAGEDPDIARSFGTRLPATAAALWLNLGEERVEWLAETASQWVDAWRRQDADTVSARSEELYDVARWLVADRQQHPHDPAVDPASSLLSETIDGEGLDPELIVGALRQSLVVGMVAPPLLIGSMAWHLSQNPELLEYLRRHPEQRSAATEEYIRLFSPYRGFARTVSRPTTLHDKDIAPEEPITLVYAAANRDPRKFSEPDRFVLNRPNITDHLGFGKGRHQCVGMHLARGTIRLALEAIVSNSAAITLLKEPAPTRMPELGYQEVHVRIDPMEVDVGNSRVRR